MFIDTHIHLYAGEYNSDRDILVAAARDKGISRCLLPNIDETSVRDLLELCMRNPGFCYPMMGLHPCSVTSEYRTQLEHIGAILEAHEEAMVGIGEIGIDLYWDKSLRMQQEAAFATQLEWADARSLPVSIHSRDATEEVLAIIRQLKLPRLNGIFHCFSGSREQAEEAISLGFLLGIGGVVTFRNAGLDKLVEEFPLSSIVLETDGPYLAPAPHRGKRNEPAWLRIIAEKVASIKDCTIDEVGRITTENARNIFRKVD